MNKRTKKAVRRKPAPKKTTALAVRKPKKAVRRKPAPKKTTALAVRKPVPVPVPGPDWGGLIPGGAAPLSVKQLTTIERAIDRRITDETLITTLGLHTLRLSKREEEVMARPVNVDDVRIKPSGQPYVSHPTYTKWFNEAFGRLQWALVPASKPVRTDKGVARDFLFHVHGKPVAHAQGEQDYHEKNAEQSYGDALEACNASALRRLAKRMGVGLELWDRVWIDRYVAEHCILVKTSKGKKWRRKVDEPFWNEQGAARRDDDDDDATQRRAPQQTPERASGDTRLITKGTRQKPGQVERLWVIIRSSGRNEQTVRDWLHTAYEYTSTRDIQRRHYDAICTAIEAKGPLPGRRDPGEEG